MRDMPDDVTDCAGVPIGATLRPVEDTKHSRSVSQSVSQISQVTPPPSRYPENQPNNVYEMLIPGRRLQIKMMLTVLT